jgi:hypothetical protein
MDGEILKKAGPRSNLESLSVRMFQNGFLGSSRRIKIKPSFQFVIASSMSLRYAKNSNSSAG